MDSVAMTVFIKRLHPNAIIPERKTSGAAAFDIHACIEKPIYMHRDCTYKIPTGLAMELPPSLMGLIFVRSGAALKGVSVEHPPIDSDYRGEIHILARWHGDDGKRANFIVMPGDRIAQLLFVVALHPPFLEVDALQPSTRGEGAFGSTDVEVDPNAVTAVIEPASVLGDSDVWPDPYVNAGDTKPIDVCPHGNDTRDCAVCTPIGR
jgi:dUTP pyrophosphatase